MWATLFEHIPAGPCWIFTMNRELNEEEYHNLTNYMDRFLDQWTAHGHEVEADYMIWENRILIIAANEASTMVSGCSKDSLYRALQFYSQIHHIDFFDRTQLCTRRGSDLSWESWAELADNPPKDVEIFDATINNVVDLRSDPWLDARTYFI